MIWTPEELKLRIAGLPSHVKDNMIYGVAWDAFGDSDDHVIESINTDRVPPIADLKSVIGWFRDELVKERPELRVQEVIRNGELEIEPGHTIEEITELACECLNAANSWDICGEVLFQGNDGRYYVGTVEFVIAPGNPVYVGDVLKGYEEEEEAE